MSTLKIKVEEIFYKNNIIKRCVFNILKNNILNSIIIENYYLNGNIKSEQLDNASLVKLVKALLTDLPKLTSPDTGGIDTTFLSLDLATAVKKDSIISTMAKTKNWSFK